MVYVPIYFILLLLTPSPEITYTAEAEPVIVVYTSPLDTMRAYSLKKDDQISHYAPLYKYVSKHTGFPESFIFAIMFQEHSKGSHLLLEHNNIGNVKYDSKLHKHGWKAAKDDKYVNGRLVPSKFASFPTLKIGAYYFVKFLRRSRWQKCRGLRGLDLCKCFKEQRYHTDDSHFNRAKLMNYYESRTSRARYKQTAYRFHRPRLRAVAVR